MVTRSMKCDKSKSDLCSYFKVTGSFLLLWLWWIDSQLCVGPLVEISKARKEILSKIECNDVEEVKEYLGYPIDRNLDDRWVKLTHHVLLQSYEDEFNTPPRGMSTNNNTLAGSVISLDVQDKDIVEKDVHSSYMTGVGKLLHVAR